MGNTADIHRSHSQNHGNGDFRSDVHLQIPYQEHRQNGHRPVGPTRNGRVPICCRDSNIWVDTRPLSSGVSSPEVCTGTALEDEKKEEKGAVGCMNHHDGPDDGLVDRRDSNSHQHYSNAQLECHVRQDVDRFTCPPPLQTDRNVRWWNNGSVLSSAILDSGNGEPGKEHKEELDTC